MLIQRGTPLRGNGPNGGIGNGLAWTSRYTVVGLNALGLKDIIPDGMNERAGRRPALHLRLCGLSNGAGWPDRANNQQRPTAYVCFDQLRHDRGGEASTSQDPG